jgi:zinc transporter ZupT
VTIGFELLGFVFGYYILKRMSFDLLGASLALAAGFMTYISVEELIPAAQIKKNFRVGVSGLILGFVCVLLIGLLG